MTDFQSIQLNESEVLKLPYYGPIGRRIYVIIQEENATCTKELFVQRNDAFTTNLVGLLKSLKAGEISEIRYTTGYEGFVHIFINENGEMSGEYFYKTEKTLTEFKRKLGLK